MCIPCQVREKNAHLIGGSKSMCFCDWLEPLHEFFDQLQSLAGAKPQQKHVIKDWASF